VESNGQGLLIYAKNLSDPHVKAVVLFNRADWGSAITVHWKAIGLDVKGSFKSYVPPHGVVMIEISSRNP
jgi:hypothetical protein